MSRALNCTESALSLDDLFKLAVVDEDGDALTCDDIHFTLQDLLKAMIRVNADGTTSLAINLSGSMTITFGGGRWRLFVDAADGYRLKTQKSIDGVNWITTNTEIF